MIELELGYFQCQQGIEPVHLRTILNTEDANVTVYGQVFGNV